MCNYYVDMHFRFLLKYTQTHLHKNKIHARPQESAAWK